MNNAVPILLYHRIDESGLATATRPQDFRKHMSWLNGRGWRSLTNEELTYYLRSGKAFPRRSFVITFDDGYESMATAGFETLQEFRYSATCFISTRFLRGATTTVHDVADDEASQPFMSWEQARALHSCGVIDFQSHSHTHRNFSKFSPEEAVADLQISREILAQELALPASHFEHLAWPWGMSTPDGRLAAKKGGFNYQYTVARQSFVPGSALDEIPRTCFDAAAFEQFQRQFWLQSGQLAHMWNIAYPFGRRLRQLTGL